MRKPSAIVLAGGLGTRLSSVIGDQTPKALALVQKKPFLWYLFDYIKQQGIMSVVLATGHLSSCIQQSLHQLIPSGMHVQISEEPNPLGTAGAVKLAMCKIGDDSFFVFNGDSLCTADMDKFLSFHYQKHAVASILLHKMENTERYGVVEIDEEDGIVHFCEKKGSRSPGLINAGVYLIRRKMLSQIPSETLCSLEENVFPNIVHKQLFGFTVDDPFIDIGTPDSYQAAQHFFDNWRCIEHKKS